MFKALKSHSFSFLSKEIQQPFKQKFLFSNSKEALKWHGTTILSVKKNKEIVLIGDGQVSYGSMRVKTNGRKIRKIGDNVLCGFAGKVLEVSFPVLRFFYLRFPKREKPEKNNKKKAVSIFSFLQSLK